MSEVTLQTGDTKGLPSSPHVVDQSLCQSLQSNHTVLSAPLAGLVLTSLSFLKPVQARIIKAVRLRLFANILRQEVARTSNPKP